MWIEEWHCELLYEIIFKKMTLSAIFFKFFEIITNNNSYHFVTHYELILYNTKQQKKKHYHKYNICIYLPINSYHVFLFFLVFF